MMKPHLFLLHFSGGNKYSFNFLKPHLEDTFDCIPLELPGRGMRIAEPFKGSMTEAAEDLLQQIVRLNGSRPFLIYGHSLGGSLGLLITQRLETIGLPPLYFVASGNSGPGPEASQRHQYFIGLSEADFIAELQKLGGFPDEILSNKELMDFMIPILRADFKLFGEAINYKKIQTPIHAIMGEEEEMRPYIENWRGYTSGDCKITIYPGHHFFIYDYAVQLAQHLKDALRLAQEH